tara:strand:- start:58852 stop:59655 length:804 start_codon:yes stop_codon:yes gene_type:complete
MESPVLPEDGFTSNTPIRDGRNRYYLTQAGFDRVRAAAGHAGLLYHSIASRPAAARGWVERVEAVVASELSKVDTMPRATCTGCGNTFNAPLVALGYLNCPACNSPAVPRGAPRAVVAPALFEADRASQVRPVLDGVVVEWVWEADPEYVGIDYPRWRVFTQVDGVRSSSLEVAEGDIVERCIALCLRRGVKVKAESVRSVSTPALGLIGRAWWTAEFALSEGCKPWELPALYVPDTNSDRPAKPAQASRVRGNSYAGDVGDPAHGG